MRSRRSSYASVMLELALGFEAQGLDDEAEAIREEVRTMQAGAAVIGLPVSLVK